MADPKKTKWHLLDFDFLAQVVEIMRQGADRPGRSEGQWKDLPSTEETENAYFNACLRHLVAARKAERFYIAVEHFAAVAANAMILAYHAHWREEEKDVENDSGSDLADYYKSVNYL